jgi:hypothetical protein
MGACQIRKFIGCMRKSLTETQHRVKTKCFHFSPSVGVLLGNTADWQKDFRYTHRNAATNSTTLYHNGMHVGGRQVALPAMAGRTTVWWANICTLQLFYFWSHFIKTAGSLSNVRILDAWIPNKPSPISWDILPCSLLNIKWHFGGTCRFHLQGRSKWSKKQV